MKKIGTIVMAILFLMGMSACNKKAEAIEVLDASTELFQYEGTEEADGIAVDENGILYTISYKFDEKAIEKGDVVARQKICAYDLEGNCIEEVELRLGRGTARGMLAEENRLYLLLPESIGEELCSVIYEVDTVTWNAEKIAEIAGMSMIIKNFIHIDDAFYIVGVPNNPEAKNYVLHPDVIYYEYAGETVVKVSCTGKDTIVEMIPVDFPIEIFATKENTLIIYHYNEEHGFGFLEFDPKALTLAEVGWKPGIVKDKRFFMCEDGYLFSKEDRLYYGTLNGMEAELSEEEVIITEAITYQKGFAFYKNQSSASKKLVERLCVQEIVQENKVINVLMHQDTQDKPYGCGYRMEKTVLSSEQYALKVLAQDSDFDLYLLSSRDNSSYNLKKNGAFYPLNEVDGVQEYLDACFPYVKNLAINEDGDIWMVPVALSIPGLVYNKEYCEENDVDLSSMDFSEFLQFTKEVRRTTPEQASISLFVAQEDFFGQYLLQYDSFDTEVFRSYAKQFEKICSEEKHWRMDTSVSNALNEGLWPNFYYLHEIYQISCSSIARYVGESERIGMIGVPTISEESGNVGTITFIAVNPQSTNLEATLEYISAYAKYMSSKKDSFLLADETTYTDTPFVQDWYQVYANGAVRFDMDEEIYENLFFDFLAGKAELEETVAEMERRRKIYMEE